MPRPVVVTMHEIMKELTVEELRELRDLHKKTISIIKQRTAIEDSQKMLDFYQGANVIMTGDSKKVPKGAPGVIEKINRTRCSVDFGSYGLWTVPVSMMELEKETADV